jgi:hypothetical protein
MIPKGHYTLTFDGKEINLRFTTWTMSRFAEISGGLSFSEVVELFAEGKLTIKQIINLLLAGAEYVCLRENKKFSYNELDASDWIDSLGGPFAPKVQELLVVVAKSLVPQVEPQEGEAEEKKSSE